MKYLLLTASALALASCVSVPLECHRQAECESRGGAAHSFDLQSAAASPPGGSDEPSTPSAPDEPDQPDNSPDEPSEPDEPSDPDDDSSEPDNGDDPPSSDLGNPGNNKDVGRAGEDPANCGCFGDGERGVSDTVGRP